MGIFDKVKDVVDDGVDVLKDVGDKAGGIAGGVIETAKDVFDDAKDTTVAVAKFGAAGVAKIGASGLDLAGLLADVVTNPLKTVKIPTDGNTTVGYMEIWASHWKLHLTKEFLDKYEKAANIATTLGGVGGAFASAGAAIVGVAGTAATAATAGVAAAIGGAIVAYIAAEWVIIQQVKNNDGVNLFGSLAPLLQPPPIQLAAALVVPLPGDIG